MRCAALLAIALVGCIEGGAPDPTEMVIYGVADRGDLIISGGMIRWTNGTSAFEAPLASMPIDGRYATPLADTNRDLAVHGDTVYVVDSTGIVAFTNGQKARVVTQPDVHSVVIPDDNELYWTDSNGLSWFGAGGLNQSAYVYADAIIEVVSFGGEIYATTVGYYTAPPFGQLVYESKLVRIDKGAGNAVDVANAAVFNEEFIDDGHFGAGDEYKTGGLWIAGGQMYWSIFLDTMNPDYDQRLVERKTATGFEQVLAPGKHRSKLMVSDGAFYWSAEDGLWRAAPGGEPELVLGPDLYIEAVIDNYAYGYVPAIGGVGLDLRRISLLQPIP